MLLLLIPSYPEWPHWQEINANCSCKKTFCEHLLLLKLIFTVCFTWIFSRRRNLKCSAVLLTCVRLRLSSSFLSASQNALLILSLNHICKDNMKVNVSKELSYQANDRSNSIDAVSGKQFATALLIHMWTELQLKYKSFKETELSRDNPFHNTLEYLISRKGTGKNKQV